MEQLVILGCGRQAFETSGYLLELGHTIRCFLESTPAKSRPDEEEYPGEIRGIDQLPLLTETSLFISAVGDTSVRRRLVELAINAKFTNCISPHAWVSSHARLGLDVTIAPMAVINAAADIQDHTLINVGSIVSHDVVIGPFVTLGPRSAIGGNARIGEGSYLGIGSVVLDGVTIGKSVVVGAGAVVINDIKDGQTVVGVPALPIIQQ